MVIIWENPIVPFEMIVREMEEAARGFANTFIFGMFQASE